MKPAVSRPAAAFRSRWGLGRGAPPRPARAEGGGGPPGGSLGAAAPLPRVERPLRVYALLELGIGLYALGSLPLLQGLASVDVLLGAGRGPRGPPPGPPPRAGRP